MTTVAPCQSTPPCPRSSSHRAAEASESLADQYYQPLRRFALGLTRSPRQAADLVQQKFYLCALRGHQLRERHEAKSWLYTTLYREVRRRTLGGVLPVNGGRDGECPSSGAVRRT